MCIYFFHFYIINFTPHIFQVTLKTKVKLTHLGLQRSIKVIILLTVS